MADGEQDTDGAQRFLTFRLDDRLYAVVAKTVAEVIRVPTIAHVPNGPRSLMGLANLRGTVLPIASLRGILGQPERTTEASRAIVLEGAAPVGLAVDAVEALVTIEDDRIETRQAELAAEPGERLSGAFRTEGSGVAKILDLRALLDAAFVQRAKAPRTAGGDVAGFALHEAQAEDERQKLVTFDVAGQEFALGLEYVREIIPAPSHIAAAPHSEALVLGVMAYRDTLLPLLSLRGLLGFGEAGGGAAGRKVVVTIVGGAIVGLVADQMRAIVRVDPSLLEATPPMLAARTGGEAQIKAIYRGEGGRRLISVLDPKRLFREDVMERLGTAKAAPAPAAAEQTGEELLFLVFRLGPDEFGLPIEVVDEVARVPEQITRLPKTPAFLEGVVNVRGDVVPVIDQRQRFDMPPAADLSARRLVIVRTERHRAGLIVDSVSEVLRSNADSIGPAPDLAGESVRLVHGVLNLQAAGRLIMLLDPAELLSRAERGLLDVFETEQAKA